MEIKYEEVFGDQAMFDRNDAPDDCEIIGDCCYKVTNGDVKVWNFSEKKWCKHYKKSFLCLAMRRIIKEPKRWTWEDKKAGVLPEVGAKCNHCHSTDVKGLISVTDRYIGIECDNCDIKPYFVTHAEFLQYYIPSETPEEKARRERDEWAKKTSQFIDDELDCVNIVGEHVMRRFYNAMLSGELPMPGKE